MAEGDGLVLIFGAVSRSEADLRQAVIEARLLGDLRKLAVVRRVPARPLRDLADDETARHIGYPIGEADRFGRRCIAMRIGHPALPRMSGAHAPSYLLSIAVN